MFRGSKSAAKAAEWSGVTTKLLTNSYVASDEMVIDFAKRVTIYPFYAAGATESGNSLDFVLECNPLDSTSDPSGTYWSQTGNYIDSAGTWQEENAKFLVSQGVALSYEPGVPLDFTNLNASRIRFKCKENGVSANYGNVRIWVVKSDIS
jgi:hypothetical protein